MNTSIHVSFSGPNHLVLTSSVLIIVKRQTLDVPRPTCSDSPVEEPCLSRYVPCWRGMPHLFSFFFSKNFSWNFWLYISILHNCISFLLDFLLNAWNLGFLCYLNWNFRSYSIVSLNDKWLQDKIYDIILGNDIHSRSHLNLLKFLCLMLHLAHRPKI